MNQNRVHMALLTLVVALLTVQGIFLKRQDDDMRKVSSSLVDIRQSLEEVRAKIPPLSPMGMAGSGRGPAAMPGPTNQFPPIGDPQSGNGNGGNGNGGNGNGGNGNGGNGNGGNGNGGNGNGGNGNGGNGKQGSEASSGGEKKPGSQNGNSSAAQQGSGSRGNGAGESDPELTGGGGNGRPPSDMMKLLARLIVLEYRADMALTDAQTATLKSELNRFKAHEVDVVVLEKDVTEVFTPAQRDYLKNESDLVSIKARELSSIQGKDDTAYADLALEFLEKPIRH